MTAQVRSDPAAATRGTFGIGPATSTALDPQRTALNYTAQAGASLSDHVIVTNYGTAPIELHLFAADATVGDDAQIGYRLEADPGRDAATWVRFGNQSAAVRDLAVRLAPRASRVLEVIIRVARDASPGDHLAGIIATLRGRAIGSGEQLNVDQRLAVRTMFRISGPIRSELAIEHLRVQYRSPLDPIGTGSATVTYTVRNAGNVNLSGMQRIDITGAFGRTGSIDVKAQIPLLLPGAEYPVRAHVTGLYPQLLMRARVTVRPTAPMGAYDPDLRPSSHSVTFWAVPWSSAAVVALIVLFTASTVLRRRGRRRGGSHRSGRPAASPVLAGRA